jgi:hypothetical protein
VLLRGSHVLSMGIVTLNYYFQTTGSNTVFPRAPSHEISIRDCKKTV